MMVVASVVITLGTEGIKHPKVDRVAGSGSGRIARQRGIYGGTAAQALGVKLWSLGYFIVKT
jgi:hypothetical protein